MIALEEPKMESRTRRKGLTARFDTELPEKKEQELETRVMEETAIIEVSEERIDTSIDYLKQGSTVIIVNRGKKPLYDETKEGLDIDLLNEMDNVMHALDIPKDIPAYGLMQMEFDTYQTAQSENDRKAAFNRWRLMTLAYKLIDFEVRNNSSEKKTTVKQKYFDAVDNLQDKDRTFFDTYLSLFAKQRLYPGETEKARDFIHGLREHSEKINQERKFYEDKGRADNKVFAQGTKILGTDRDRAAGFYEHKEKVVGEDTGKGGAKAEVINVDQKPEDFSEKDYQTDAEIVLDDFFKE